MSDCDTHVHDHDHGEESPTSRFEALVTQKIHEAGDHEGPFSLHVLGLGEAGAGIIESLAGLASSSGLAGFSALAVDIGDAGLSGVKEAAAGFSAETGQIRTATLPAADPATLLAGLRRYREFLKTEYPRYYWNPNYEPWLPSDISVPAAPAHYDRALSKALYGVEYYQGGEVAQEMDSFVHSIQTSGATPIVVVAFGLAGGTGSGIVVELARHLSNIKLGRRALVLGLTVLPCDGDPEETWDGRLFPTINELDCMVDTEKNNGVMAVWGDLYKNPFTAGFFAVPQSAVYARTGSLEETHRIIDDGIAAFLVRDGGIHLYESIKALNWLNVPANAWHPATRGEQGERWINLLAVGESADAEVLGAADLAAPSATFAEVRTYGAAGGSPSVISEALSFEVGPSTVAYPESTSPGVSVLVPQLSKLDLAFFVPTRSSYDTLEWEDKLMRHSWLLDLGVLLCEPSTRFEGVGGECILGCACWVVVPHAAIRGEVEQLAVV